MEIRKEAQDGSGTKVHFFNIPFSMEQPVATSVSC